MLRQRVPVVDPIDPQVKLLPRVPWTQDLPRLYRQRYGQDLIKHRESLFVGDSAADRKVRHQFWSLIADLVAERYFGAIERWCAEHRVASSGHSLWEEAVLHHVPLEGNGLKVLSRMQIPGLDLLNSDPEAVIHSGWLTAALPASAARLGGQRRVMTEVSDFSQKMGGAGPVDVSWMQATAAWQAAWGVTDFTLYYGVSDRSVEDYRAYCEFVGRLNAILRNASPDPQVLLYYPILDLWSEYLPVAEPLQVSSQSLQAQRLVASFQQAGRALQRHQIPFTLIDHENLQQARVDADGGLTVGGQRYRALVIPFGVDFPKPVADIVTQFLAVDGSVLRADADNSDDFPSALVDATPLAVDLEPPSPRICLGRFTREEHEVLLVVNVGASDYGGTMIAPAGNWLRLDPATGAVDTLARDESGRVSLKLNGRQTAILVNTLQSQSGH